MCAFENCIYYCLEEKQHCSLKAYSNSKSECDKFSPKPTELDEGAVSRATTDIHNGYYSYGPFGIGARDRRSLR